MGQVHTIQEGLSLMQCGNPEKVMIDLRKLLPFFALTAISIN